MLKLRKFQTGIYLGFLLNRLCFCHINFILEWYNLTNRKKKEDNQNLFSLVNVYSQVVTGR